MTDNNNSQPSTDTELESNEQDIKEVEIQESNDYEEINEQPKENKKRAKKRIVRSECGQEVIIKHKTKAKPTPIVVYYEDLVEQEEKPKVIVKTKRSRGRPKSKIIEYVDEDGNPVGKKTKEVKQTIINHPEPEKELSEKDLKLIQLQERITELEAVSGKKILGTKKGKIDQRSVKPPTEKQIQARKKFVEMNKARALKRKQDKEAKKQEENKSNVKDVINELAEIKKQTLQKEKEHEEMKQKILAEEAERVKKEKEKQNKYSMDMFN